MENTLENLTEALKETLSEEALKLLIGSDALKSLVDENEKLKSDLEEEKRMSKMWYDDKHKLNDEVDKFKNTIEVLEAKEKDLVAREKQVEEKEFEHRVRELQMNFQEHRGDEFKELLGSALRNIIIRKNMLEDVLTPVAAIPDTKDQYGNISIYGSPAYVDKDNKSSSSEETQE